jgi:hypothetical protein
MSASSSYNSHQNPLLMTDYFSETDLVLARHRVGSSPEAPLSPKVGGMRYHSPSFVQLKSSVAEAPLPVRDSEESQQSIAMSGVSLGSGFINTVPERTASDNTDETGGRQ